tara:strand:+ start:1557 stop:1880 length:324 start_codon:yes stop_codon:yes gene_type:complete
LIDFEGAGTIQVHIIDNRQCIQFFPAEGKTVKDMLDILDAGLKDMDGVSRGILLNKKVYRTRKGLPIPCLFLFDKRDTNDRNKTWNGTTSASKRERRRTDGDSVGVD